jgi:hypothetical protein
VVLAGRFGLHRRIIALSGPSGKIPHQISQLVLARIHGFLWASIAKFVPFRACHGPDMAYADAKVVVTDRSKRPSAPFELGCQSQKAASVKNLLKPINLKYK